MRTLPAMSDLCGDHTVAPNAHVMCDLHQVVDLATLADDGVTQGAAVDGRISADFNIVLDDGSSELGKLLLTAFGENIAEPVAANHRA